MNSLIGLSVPYLKDVVYIFEDFKNHTEFLIVVENKKVFNILWRFNNKHGETVYRSARRDYYSNDVIIEAFCSMYFEDSLFDVNYGQNSLAFKILEINNNTINKKNLPRSYVPQNYNKDFPNLTAVKV